MLKNAINIKVEIDINIDVLKTSEIHYIHFFRKILIQRDDKNMIMH